MKNFFLRLKEKINNMYSKNKKLFVFTLSLVLIVGVCLLFYPKSDNKTQDNVSIVETKLDSYADEMENKIEKMLLSLDEVDKASVMIVCDGSEVVNYLKNSTETIGSDGSTKTITEEVVYEKNGTNSSPIIVSKVMPKIVGVWVIINSVSASTKLAITNSIISVLNIGETSISILQER